MPLLRLTQSEMTVAISPEQGGGIVSFDAFGEAVLMPAAGPILAPTDPAAFTLVPYCNRIADGQAMCGVSSINLKPNLEGEPHPLHGEGWLLPWRVENAADQTAVLKLSYVPLAGRWPWAFEATQRYELADGQLTHAMSVQNKSDSPMPAGIGFHPYFLNEPGATLKAAVRGVWQANEAQLPTVHETLPQGGPWLGGGFDPDEPLDHCFTGWDRKLQIVRKKIQVTLTASSELGLLHVYAPKGAPFFCAEPVSHMPDALNQADTQFQMQMLEPGEIFKAEVAYLVEKPA